MWYGISNFLFKFWSNPKWQGLRSQKVSEENKCAATYMLYFFSATFIFICDIRNTELFKWDKKKIKSLSYQKNKLWIIRISSCFSSHKNKVQFFFIHKSYSCFFDCITMQTEDNTFNLNCMYAQFQRNRTVLAARFRSRGALRRWLVEEKKNESWGRPAASCCVCFYLSFIFRRKSLVRWSAGEG